MLRTFKRESIGDTYLSIIKVFALQVISFVLDSRLIVYHVRIIKVPAGMTGNYSYIPRSKNLGKMRELR